MNVRFCTKKIYFLLNNPFFTLVERSPRSIEFRSPSIYFWHILIRRRVSLYQSSQSLFHRPIPRNDFKNLKTSSFPTFTFAWWKVNLKIYPLWGRGRAVACAGRTHVVEKGREKGIPRLWTNEREEERRVKCGRHATTCIIPYIDNGNSNISKNCYVSISCTPFNFFLFEEVIYIHWRDAFIGDRFILPIENWNSNLLFLAPRNISKWVRRRKFLSERRDCR